MTNEFKVGDKVRVSRTAKGPRHYIKSGAIATVQQVEGPQGYDLTIRGPSVTGGPVTQWVDSTQCKLAKQAMRKENRNV